MALTMWLWRDPASRVVAANPYDSDQFAWFFRYDATAVAHLRLPALVTTGMNAPQGVNLMWNTPMLAPGVLLAPLTLLAGPQASITVLLTAGFAGSALAMFAVLKRWGVSGRAAAGAGLLYGFSPALVQSAQGHYDLQFAVLPPLIVDAALQLAGGRCGPGRPAAARCGGRLGLLAAAQLFIAEELLFDSAVAAAIALTVLAVGRRPGRPAGARAADLAVGAGAAVAVGGLIAGYPLWVQFLGPLRQRGSPFIPDYYKNDLAGFVQPSSSMLAHTHSSAAFAAAFQGGPPEYLAYLGWPMLIALAAATALFWSQPPVRAAAVTFALLELFSLGGTLLAGGDEHSGVALPWYLLQTLPLAGSVVPDRFSILADGAAAALLAFALDSARARWPDAERVIFVVALVALAPLVPRPLPAGSEPPAPAGWTAAFAALRLPAGAHVLVLPLPVSTFTEPLRWQADTGVPSSMYGGYFMGPDGSGQAATDGGGPPPAGRYLDWLWARSAPGDAAARTPGLPASVVPASVVPAPVIPAPVIPTPGQLRAQLAAWNPAAVVAVAGPQSALGRYLTSVLGPPWISGGGVLGWRFEPAAATCPRGPSARAVCGPSAGPCPACPSP